jgi:formylmethanofuran dehydrogenase subunit E
MIIDVTFKRVVDFHGHLCPDLVIGGKLCEYVQKLVDCNDVQYGGMSMVAENCTSALDAIQAVLGITVGNQRLRVLDYGKHSYTIFSPRTDTCCRLSMRPRNFGDEQAYFELERKIQKQYVSSEEVIRFQRILDQRVGLLMDLSPETLFEVNMAVADPPPSETANVYVICCKCGEPVLKSHTIERKNKLYCIPCFQNCFKWVTSTSLERRRVS